MRLRAAAATLVAVVACGRDAWAQAPGGAPGRFEVSAGALWTGHQALGDTAANETTGTAGSLRIFTSSSDLAAATGFEARFAVRVVRSLEAEVNASYSTPRLKVTISNDIENAPAITAEERIRQITVGGGVVWYVPTRRATARLAPFVTAGGGYLRDVHQADTFIETGRFYQFGAGVKYLLFDGRRGPLKALGARVDARAILRADGVAFDEKLHAAPAFGASVFTRF